MARCGFYYTELSEAISQSRGCIMFRLFFRANDFTILRRYFMKLSFYYCQPKPSDVFDTYFDARSALEHQLNADLYSWKKFT